MSSELSQHGYYGFIIVSLRYKLGVWSFKDLSVLSRDGLTSDAFELHYGKCRIQCLDSYCGLKSGYLNFF